MISRPWVRRAVAGALPLLAAVWLVNTFLLSPARGQSIIQPTYTIEAVSGTHTTPKCKSKKKWKTCSLKTGQLGVVAQPAAVDVNEDLIPDVAVSVNIVDVAALVGAPGQVLAPNIVIDRLFDGIPLGSKAIPLRINVRLSIKDSATPKITRTLRFGYDTANGGSIPPAFKALVSGLQNNFNPFDASIDTRGAPLDPDNAPFGYQGPLTPFAQIITPGAAKTDPPTTIGVDLAYKPFPQFVHARFGSDASGFHFLYEHGQRLEPSVLPEVDLDTHMNIDEPTGTKDGVLRFQRLPRSLTGDALVSEEKGNIDIRTSADGRLPDVTGAFKADPKPTGETLDANFWIEALPRHMHGEWSMPSSGEGCVTYPADPPSTDPVVRCPTTASFNSTDQGIGAVELDVRNFRGAPQLLKPFVPDSRQFINAQVAVVTPAEPTDRYRPELLLSGRLERIREATFGSKADGSQTAHIEVGDGERPLILHGSVDGPSRRVRGEATSKISPLPDSIQVDFFPGDELSATKPLRLHYTASEAVDIDANAKVFFPLQEPMKCGDKGSTCATIKVRHVPKDITADIFNLEAGDQHDDSRIQIASIPRAVNDHTSVFVDADIDQTDTLPLVVHAEARDLPKNIAFRTVEGDNETLQRLEFHACQRDWNAQTCATNSTGELGELSFSVRNFLTRPTDIVPAYATTPNFATITARQRPPVPPRVDPLVEFEATGRIQKVQDVIYINKGVIGLQTKAGGGGELSAIADIKGVDLQGDDPSNGPIDIDAEAVIYGLPTFLNFCFNQPGQPITSPVDPVVTGKCQSGYPFAVQKTPLSFSYDAVSDFAVFTKAAVTLHGPTSGAADDRTYKGTLNVQHLPARLSAHIAQPPEGKKGPLLARITTLPKGTQQINAQFSAEILDGGMVCKDPRPPSAGKQALCFKARLFNLPTFVHLLHDPSIKKDNFKVFTSGTEQMDIEDIEVSSVALTDGQPDIMIATGKILGLPRTVTGTLDLPDKAEGSPNFALTADPPIRTVDAVVRNFIAPDPMPKPPTQRGGLPAPTQSVTYLQRDRAFKVIAQVGNLQSLGYRTARDAAGNRLDSHVASIDFGDEDQVVRAYADIQRRNSKTDIVKGLGPGERTIADVTLTDVPAGIDICLRGKKLRDTPPAGEATFCDGSSLFPVDGNEGAFQIRGQPGFPTNSPMDVHAFFRHATLGGADILAGRLDADNVPFVLQGTYPTSDDEGDIDVAGFQSDGVTPDGVDQIAFTLASADISNDGYTSANRPFRLSPAPFRPPASSNQHAFVTAREGDVSVDARIGPTSQLQRLQWMHKACAKPTSAGTRPDYPRFPLPDVDTHYTCLRGNFQTQPGDDRLDVDIVKEEAGNLISFQDGGITDVPSFFQTTLSQDQIFAGSKQSLRRPCGPDAQEANNADCMPPLLRVDQLGAGRVFGVLKVGRSVDIDEVGKVRPQETMADLDQRPALWVGSDRGIRAKVGAWDPALARAAAMVGVNIAVPASLTVDQPQIWAAHKTMSQPEYWNASDTRFHYAVRGANGEPVESLGRLSALLHFFDTGGQVLLSRPCATKPNKRDEDHTCEADYSQGMTLPGELGLNLYVRNHTGNGRDFVQLDGKTSTTLDTGIRVLGGVPGLSIGRLEASAKIVPSAGDPAFRIRLEAIKEGHAPPGPGTDSEGGTAQQCTPFLCVNAEARLKSAYAAFDLAPDPGNPAHLVEAVIRQNGPLSQGLEVKSYADMERKTPARITADGAVELRPVNVILHAGLPLLASVDFAMFSQLTAGFHINANHFTLRHNLLHVKATSEGGDSVLGPVDHYIRLLHGTAWGLLQPVFGIEYLPPSILPPSPLRTPVATEFLGCPDLKFAAPAVGGSNQLDIPESEGIDAVLWPFQDKRMWTWGPLAGLVDLLKTFGEPLFCVLPNADELELMNAKGEHPGDPVGIARTGHTVPGAVDSSSAIVKPVPDVTSAQGPQRNLIVSAPDAMCGTFAFDEVQVNALLKVAANADSSPVYAGGPSRCDAANAGRLELFARKITVSSAIDANAVSTSEESKPTNTGGAGHRGSGGDGTLGSTKSGKGPPYGADLFTAATEPGSKADSPFGSALGGGTITLRATREITVASRAEITANGADGHDISRAPCDDNSMKPGFGGWGAGSGGGVLIVAPHVVVNGTISARGGEGGTGTYGGGGGGGGGAVKIFSPDLFVNVATVDGGKGGTGFCNTPGRFPEEGPDGDPGRPGDRTLNDDSVSRAEPLLDGFWSHHKQSDPLRVPFSANVNLNHGAPYNVYLCGIPRSPADVNATAHNPPAEPTFFPFPPFARANSAQLPCGSLAKLLGKKENLSSAEVIYDPPSAISTIQIDPNVAMDDAYWGLWTVVVQLGGKAYVQPLSSKPQLMIGIDNANPVATFVKPASNTATRTQKIPLLINVEEPDGVASGIAKLECSNEVPTVDSFGFPAPAEFGYSPCADGANDWILTSGDGLKTVSVRATDFAGNQGGSVLPIVLDTVPPGAPDPAHPLNGPPNRPGVTLTPGVPPSGWYKTAPDVTVFGFDDASPSSGAGDPAFAFRFDFGNRRTCASNCVVPGTELTTLEPGEHVISATAIDRAGNQFVDDDDPDTASPTRKTAFKLDPKPPVSSLLSVPEAFDGKNGWFAQLPWITFSAIDQNTGSGFPAADTNAGVFYVVSNAGVTPPKAATRYEAPFQLHAGQYDVCWFARDAAGNEEPQRCQLFKVDHQRPSAVPRAITPSAPDGTNGWYTSDVTVRIVTSDPSPGSGVESALGGTIDPNLCGPVIGTGLNNITNIDRKEITAAPSGTCVSIDGEPFRAHFGDFVLPEGLHEVRSFATDRAGNRSPISTALYFIDESDPAATVRTVPADATRGGWYRWMPRTVLRAVDGDRNSGAQTIDYRLDGAPFARYTEPFTVGAGVHTLEFRTTDGSGRALSKTVILKPDVNPPAITPKSADPLVWVRVGNVFGPTNAKLNWEIRDALSGDIKINVVVYNQLGRAVRVLDGGTKHATPNVPLVGYTEWDGQIPGQLAAPAGLYYFRVIAYDEAGNIAESWESNTFTIKIGP